MVQYSVQCLISWEECSPLKKGEIWKREGVSDASCVTTLKCDLGVRVRWANADLDVQAAPHGAENDTWVW